MTPKLDKPEAKKLLKLLDKTRADHHWNAWENVTLKGIENALHAQERTEALGSVRELVKRAAERTQALKSLADRIEYGAEFEHFKEPQE